MNLKYNKGCIIEMDDGFSGSRKCEVTGHHEGYYVLREVDSAWRWPKVHPQFVIGFWADIDIAKSVDDMVSL